jgi:hypothetical protein
MVSVTAPSNAAAEPLRKIVTEYTEPVESAASWRSAYTAKPAPKPAAVPHLPATEQEHLPGAQPLLAPLPGPVDPAPVATAPDPVAADPAAVAPDPAPVAADQLPDPGMTVPVNLFSALP